MNCVDLRSEFGDRYRVRFNAGHEGTTGAGADIWGLEMLCKGRGVTIYPIGGQRLAVEVDYRPSIVRKLMVLLGPPSQDGDHEKTFYFDLEQFQAVAEIVQPRRRRVLSEAQKAKLASAGARHRFSCGAHDGI
jgi:hypothetical protein